MSIPVMRNHIRHYKGQESVRTCVHARIKKTDCQQVFFCFLFLFLFLVSIQLSSLRLGPVWLDTSCDCQNSCITTNFLLTSIIFLVQVFKSYVVLNLSPVCFNQGKAAVRNLVHYRRLKRSL